MIAFQQQSLRNTYVDMSYKIIDNILMMGAAESTLASLKIIIENDISNDKALVQTNNDENFIHKENNNLSKAHTRKIDCSFPSTSRGVYICIF